MTTSNMHKPSRLVSPLLLLPNKNKSNAASKTTTKSTRLKAVDDTVPNMVIGKANTTHILNILVPTIFPIAISNSPFLADKKVIVSSGKLVPITIIVIAIIF